MRTDSAPPPWYRQFWPWFLIVLPLAAVIGSVTTVVIAFNHQDSMVSDNYYKEGRAINRHMEMDRAAVSQRLQATVRLDGAAVEVALQGELQQWPARLTLALQHPLRAEQDITLEVLRNSETGYAGTLLQPLQGRHYLALSDAGRRWRLRGMVTPAPDGSAVIEVRADDQ